MYISVCKYASLQQDYIYIVPDHSCREKNRIIGWMPGYDRKGERKMNVEKSEPPPKKIYI